MLTNEQRQFFFELYKNTYYFEQKATIEEFYKNIEKPEVREKRDRLLLEAEQNASKFAEIAVKKIQNENFNELLKEISAGDKTSSEKFGKDVLDELEDRLNRK